MAENDGDRLNSQGGFEKILAPEPNYTRIATRARKSLARGITMNTITMVCAIVIFFVVIGFALNAIKELFKDKERLAPISADHPNCQYGFLSDSLTFRY